MSSEDVILCGICPMCKAEIDELNKILPCPCGRVFCTNCHFEIDPKSIWRKDE